MIKDLVVTMDAAETSRAVLEKEIGMKLCIIIPHCVTQVSNGRERDRNKK